jgi:hypothetical protein
VVLQTVPWSEPDSEESWPDAELANLLRLCEGVANLTIIGDLFDPRILTRVVLMQPTYLSVAADLVAPRRCRPAIFNFPFFQHITHVHLFDAEVHLFEPDAGISADWQHWSQLSRLPVLTHLAIPCQTPTAIVPTILADLPSLQALLLLAKAFVDGEWISRHLPVGDPRVVVVQSAWELGARGTDDFWARAGRFYSQKQSGEIQGLFCSVGPQR